MGPHLLDLRLERALLELVAVDDLCVERRFREKYTRAGKRTGDVRSFFGCLPRDDFVGDSVLLRRRDADRGFSAGGGGGGGGDR